MMWPNEPVGRLRGVSLQDYLPLAPIAGKLPAHRLLEMAESVQQTPELPRLVRSCVETLGCDETVWRVKSDGGRMSFELYFWSHARMDPPTALRRVLQHAGVVMARGVDWSVIDRVPVLCVSLDLPLTDRNELDHLSVYTELLPSTAGYYRIDRSGARFRGTQSRFSARSEWSLFEAALGRSPQLGGLETEDVVPTRLQSCEWVYLTHKPDTDGIYLTGLNLHQFRWYLKWARFPDRLLRFVDDESSRLDHLRFDIGYDMSSHDDRPRTAGFYGSV